MGYLSRDYSIKDLAKECDISVSTVSKVLNGYPNISEKTRKKVLETADRYGYVPNAAAKILKKSTSKNIVLMINDPFHIHVNLIIMEYTKVMRGAGYDLVICYINGEDPVFAALKAIKESRAVGVVFLGKSVSGREREIEGFGIPVILHEMDAKLSTVDNISSFYVNEVMESYRMTKFLQERGAKRIAFFTTEKEGPMVGGLRTLGYKMALEEENPNLIISVEGNHYKGGYDNMAGLMQSDVKTDAVLCVSDRIAMGCCRALYDLKRKIPAEVMVAGFDGSEFVDYMIPSITTINLPIRQIYHDSAEHLLDRICRHVPKCCRCYECTITEKESTAVKKN